MAAGGLSDIATSRSSAAHKQKLVDIGGIGLTRTYFPIGPRIN